MSNESQYYSPIIQAMVESQQQRRQQDQMKQQATQFALEQKLREQQLDLQKSQVENEREYHQNSLQRLIDQHHDEKILNITKGALMGIKPEAFGAVSSGAGIPGVEDRNLTLSSGQQIPLSSIPSQEQQLAALREQSQAKEQMVKTPAFVKQELGNDIPDEVPISTLNTYSNIVERKLAFEDSNRTKSGVADTQAEWHKYVADQADSTKRLISAMKPNTASEKIALNDAQRQAFLQSGGDWNKVRQMASQGAFGQYSSDIFDHADKVLKLPAAIQNKVDTASASIDQVGNAIKALKDFATKHPDTIGSGYEHPIIGAKRFWQETTGTEPDDIGAVDSALASVAAMQPQQHGFRGTQAMEEFKKATGIDFRTNRYDSGHRAWLVNPDKAIQGLQGIASFNNTLKGNFLNGAGRANTPTAGQKAQLNIRNKKTNETLTIDDTPENRAKYGIQQ